MRWTKLKNLVEERFAQSVQERVSIHSTRYGNCTCGRAWLTLDGNEIANFCTRAHYNIEENIRTPSQDSLRKFEQMPVSYGELSRQDAYQSCWAFVHDLSIDEALLDPDALIQTLAVLDSRLGKRRLATIDPSVLHPMARRLFEIRVQSEGIEREDG